LGFLLRVVRRDGRVLSSRSPGPDVSVRRNHWGAVVNRRLMLWDREEGVR